ELYARLAEMGGEVLLETVGSIEKGTLSPQKQDDSLSCYSPMIRKEMSSLDFSKSVREIHNTIRGVTGFTLLNGKRLKVFKSEIVAGSSDAENGTVINPDNFTVKCGDGGLIKFDEIQLEGSKRMKTADFLRGKKLVSGEKLG
ncbi:MAG: methionyl-tRNA formyltransferase, partial [Ruminococcus sp.]|nr:methionyl-tRNA formyltransferase [Ruminococcus sp.]